MTKLEKVLCTVLNFMLYLNYPLFWDLTIWKKLCGILLSFLELFWKGRKSHNKLRVLMLSMLSHLCTWWQVFFYRYHRYIIINRNGGNAHTEQPETAFKNGNFTDLANVSKQLKPCAKKQTNNNTPAPK